MKPQNFLSHLIYLFLFVLPLQTIYFLREPFVGGVKWEYGVIGIYAIDLLLLVCVMWFLTEAFFFKKYQIPNIKYQISDLILLVFLFWAGVSIFWASDQMLASYFFMKLLLASGLFFVVRLIEVDMKKVVFVLLVAGVLQSGIGIAQFLSQQSIDSSMLGMSAYDASTAGSSVLKIDSGRFLRAYGTFPHPNILGGFLGVILVLCISYYVFCIKYERSWKCVTEIVTILSGMLIIFLGLILTFSRTAWMGVVLGIATLAIYSNFSNVTREQRSRFRVTFFQVLGVLVMAGVVFVGILHEQIFPRFDTKAIEREGSVSERIISLQDAERLIAEHPIIGVGGGDFTTAIIEKGEMGIMGERGETGSRPVWSIQPAHNVFVLILSELGIVGLVLFVLFLVSLFKSVIPAYEPGSRKAIQESWIPGQARDDNLSDSFFKKENGPMLIGALLTLIPSLFLDHWLWSSHFGLLFLFLLLGFATRRS